ncbi:MAG: hypothetical protein ACRC6M_07125 [Microcystaceae cyanobacterium]
MVNVQMLEQQIAELDSDSLAKLRDWFVEFDQLRWEKQIEADSNSGKLDFLINAGLAEYQAGEVRDL